MRLLIIMLLMQGVVVAVAFVVLRLRLRHELLDAAAEELQKELKNHDPRSMKVISARPLPHIWMSRIEEILRLRHVHNACVFEVDAALKEGVRIELGDAILDFSLASRMKTFFR